MKTMLHPDYWAEVPAGESPMGYSDAQRLAIWRTMLDKVGYAQKSPQEQARMNAIVEELQQGRERFEKADYKLIFPYLIAASALARQRMVTLPTFYIARFQITRHQYGLYTRDSVPAQELPGALEEPEYWTSSTGKLVSNRCPESVQSDIARQLCEQLEGRFPMADEWEKAARGTDGRLYPWGDEWDESRGFFYYGQHKPKQCSDGKPPVDAYPSGVSPYGVWGMAGGLPEVVIARPGIKRSNGLRGRHPREAEANTAWWNHLLGWESGHGDWVAARPVLDRWPKQQWPGVTLDSEA